MDLDSLKKSLMAPDFDVEKYAGELIQSGDDLVAHRKGLEKAEAEIDRLIQEQVSTHHDDLLAQAVSVEKLESHLEMMQAHMKALQSSSDRLKSKLKDPHKVIRNQTTTLGRLQETCDLLRRIIRVAQLTKKLQSQMTAGSSEVAKAALSLRELSELWNSEMDKIDIVESDQRFIQHARAEVERSADGMLNKGMEMRNLNQIGVALQVFQNLGLLDKKIENCARKSLEDIKTNLKKNLDANSLAQAGKSSSENSSSNMASLRANLWNKVERSLDLVYVRCQETTALQRSLAKKRETTFFDEISTSSDSTSNNKEIFDRFWSGAVEIVAEEFSKSTKNSNFLKQCFEGEYPKLLRLFNDLSARLSSLSASGSSEEVEAKKLKANLISTSEGLTVRVLEPFERSYLSRSLSRLFDPVNLMFSTSGETPTAEEVGQVLKTIASELNVASIDPKLTTKVAKNVAKTVKLMCVKTEGVLVTDGEASQVVGYPTEGQKKNVLAVNCLATFKTGLADIVSAATDGSSGISPLPKEASETVELSLTEVDRQIENAVRPLLSSIEEAIESIILTLHNENFGFGIDENREDAETRKHCSLYMKELQGFLSRVCAEYLRDFVCQDFLSLCKAPLAVKCIGYFITQASLVRPLGEGGQMLLASDCAQLELALEPLVGRVDPGLFGAAYTKLRAFRSVLFMKPEEVENCNELASGALPYSVALHLLFSKANSDLLKSPHESADWSVSRYSKWLENHPDESDRLQFIQGTLESYVAAMRNSKEKSYAYPYTIMLAVLQKGLANL